VYSCQTKQDDKLNLDKVSNPPVFDQVTQSKLDVISYSLEKQLKDITRKLESVEKPSNEKLLQIKFIDSLSLELDTMRNQFIDHSGGYKENTGGMMYPLSKGGAKSYFYSKNKKNNYAYKDFDKIIESLKTNFDSYLKCEQQSIFLFQNISFYRNQERSLSQPNEFLLKEKSTVEILQVIQTLKIQLEISRLKVQLNYIC